MRPTEDLLEDLGRQRVKLWLDGEVLRVSAPKDALTPSLRSELADHKPRILELLKRASQSPAFASDAFPRVPRDQPISLAPGQERLWSLAELHPNSCVYNISSAYRIDGQLDPVALEQGLRAIQRRHEILRTTFSVLRGQPRQEISATASVALPQTDLSTLPPDQRAFRLQEWLTWEITQPFDLTTAPLWRCRLLRLRPQEHVLSVVMHHIVFDGASKEVFFGELGRHYRNLVEDGTTDSSSAMELPLQFADIAAHQRAWLKGDVAARQADYWREQFAGSVDELQLPTDHARPAAPPFQGGAQPFTLPDPLAERLASLGRREEASLYITLLAAYEALLHRYTGQEDLVLCSPAACRDDRRLEGLIGFLNNVVALRTSLADNPTFRALLGRVRRVVLGAAGHQNLPFQTVSELPNLGRTPLTRGLFSYRNLSGWDFELPGLAVSVVDVRKREADFDLALYIEERSGSINGVLEYNADLFDHTTIVGLLRNFEVVLEAIVDDPDIRLDQLPRFGAGPADVEALLHQHPKIDEAVVVACADQPNAKTVAYLVLNEHDVPSLREIREHLESHLPAYLVPSGLVPLDVMPLRGDGVVDNAALPPPPLASAMSSTYVAPRTSLEKQIAEIWARVLWLDRTIGTHDNFLDLGGHSLLSVQVVAEIEQLLGRKLPVRALAQMGTIASLVQALEQEETPTTSSRTPDTQERLGHGQLSAEIYHGLHAHVATWAGKRISGGALIVGLNPEGSKQALFWSLQRYGELTQLAKYLGPDQPVYGLRSGNRVMDKTQANVNALADHYAEEIPSIQREGPYLIGGNCQAAEIGFQVAKHLLRRGHEITLLCMLEKFVPETYPGRVAMFFGNDSDRHPNLFFDRPERGWRKYYSGEISAEWIPGGHSQFFHEPNIQVLAQKVATAIEDAGAARDVEDDARSRGYFQLLPDSAYRAGLTARGESRSY